MFFFLKMMLITACCKTIVQPTVEPIIMPRIDEEKTKVKASYISNKNKNKNLIIFFN